MCPGAASPLSRNYLVIKSAHLWKGWRTSPWGVCVWGSGQLLGEEGWRMRAVVLILPEQGLLILVGLLMCWWEEIKSDQQNLSKETSCLSLTAQAH